MTVALAAAGCTDGDASRPTGSAAPSSTAAASLERALGCPLVTMAVIDQQRWERDSARAAVAALVDELDLDSDRLDPWGTGSSQAANRIAWPLFDTDGRGYGVALTTPGEAGTWVAVVHQRCPRTEVLPPAPNPSGSVAP